MQFSSSRDFHHEFGKKSILSQSMYTAYRWSHDEHTNTTRLYPKNSRTIYELVVLYTNGTGRLHDGADGADDNTLEVQCSPDLIRWPHDGFASAKNVHKNSTRN